MESGCNPVRRLDVSENPAPLCYTFTKISYTENVDGSLLPGTFPKDDVSYSTVISTFTLFP